jgi:two-component system, OmpR family, copper resistance phosphate regulon response regulator CusR
MARRCRVLIVEDEGEIQSLLRNALSLEGYEVTTTSTSASELHKATLTDYDIVIIDVAATGSAGHAAAARARAVGIGVIVVGSDPVHPGESIGHAYMLKPLSLSAMSELIRETLERTKAACETPLGSSLRVS